MQFGKSIHSAFVLSLLIVFVGMEITPAQGALNTINFPQGGTIVYGRVDGVNTKAAAMGVVLRAVHNQCGEKPRVGRLFNANGTNSVAVFFTVDRHPQGQKPIPVAGMVIASESSPGHVEAALVTDSAERFGSTVNPMLTRLFSVWHPAGAGPSESPRAGSSSAGPASLRTVVLPDRSASVGVPDSWRLDPKSAGGTLGVNGPHGESAKLNLTRMAVDPNDPGLRQLQRGGIRTNTSGKIVYPWSSNLVQAFPNLFQQFWALNNVRLTASNYRLTNLQPVALSAGQQGVQATGYVDLDGRGMQEMNALLFTSSRVQGTYLVRIFITLLPRDVADRERATMGAVLASFKVNSAVVGQQASAIAAPAIAAIHQVGREAAARSAATNAANEAQHAGYWATQKNNARNNQGFSNYLLDQTVIQDNNKNTHGTVWNSTANALVEANPNRFQYVDTPNYWKGVDY